MSNWRELPRAAHSTRVLGFVLVPLPRNSIAAMMDVEVTATE